MNEKRQRKNLTDQQQQWTLNPNDNFHVNETPIDYLSHTNTTTLIKQAVHTLLQNRPEDPIRFLADFFAPAANITSVESAYEKLSWAHYSSSVYQRNALQVYDILTTAKNEGSTLKGLLGRQFNSLLKKLCDDLPQRYSQIVFKRVHKRTDHVITFNTFYRDVLMLHVLRDYIHIVKETFHDLDVNATGEASLKLCNLIVDKLFASVIHTGSTFENTNANKDLDHVFSRLFIKSADSSLEMETMKEDDFVHVCVVKFLDNI